ncbi:hypothetical protein FOZ62_011325, partial [Perkinsus olseni]
MTAPGEHGGEPACDDSHNQFLPLLRLLGLRDEDDLNYVTEEDVRAALPLGSTLQQRVDYIRMLKTKHTDRTRSSTVTTVSSATSVLAGAAFDSDNADGKALAGILNLSPPDGQRWSGSADRRPATAFVYRIAECARMASLSPINTW